MATTIFSTVFSIFNLLLKLFVQWWREEDCSREWQTPGQECDNFASVLTCFTLAFLSLTAASKQPYGKVLSSFWVPLTTGVPTPWRIFHVPGMETGANAGAEAGSFACKQRCRPSSPAAAVCFLFVVLPAQHGAALLLVQAQGRRGKPGPREKHRTNMQGSGKL